MKTAPRSHKVLFERISACARKKKVRLSKKYSPLDRLAATIQPEKRSFGISLSATRLARGKETRLLDVGQYHKQVEFYHGKHRYVAKDVYLSKRSDPHFEGRIDVFYTKGFSEKSNYYFRLVIPLKKKIKFDFRLEDSVFSNDLGLVSTEMVSAAIHGNVIDTCCVQGNKGESYLVLESRTKQKLETFRELTFAMQLSIGYVLGYLPSDQGYFFAYSNKRMDVPKYTYFSEFRESIRSSYEPMCSNPNAYLDRKQAESYRSKKMLRRISSLELSRLAEKIYDNKEFTAVILLILESSVASLVFMPGGFAIALETLSDIIIGSRKVDTKPIPDKYEGLRDVIVKECKAVIEKYCTGTTADVPVLLNKIYDINRASNASRLKAPFDILGIKLLPEDLAVLKTRNDFLHGRSPDFLRLGASRSEKQIGREQYYASMRFYTLLNMLILKWVGYDSYVVNHAKFQEDFTKIRLPKEKVFRKV